MWCWWQQDVSFSLKHVADLTICNTCLAIMSRETRAGKTLDPDGYGRDGHGYGLMQVFVVVV